MQVCMLCWSESLNDVFQCLNTGFQVTRTNALAALHELDYQNCYKGRKVNSHVFTERTLDCCPSRSGIGTEKSNDIIQV